LYYKDEYSLKQRILGLQSFPRESKDKDMAAMVEDITKEANDKFFVFQHGGDDVTCKRRITVGIYTVHTYIHTCGDYGPRPTYGVSPSQVESKKNNSGVMFVFYSAFYTYHIGNFIVTISLRGHFLHNL
jgi:hypothetical protein